MILTIIVLRSGIKPIDFCNFYEYNKYYVILGEQ
jgi:hypothetical protein